MFAFNERISLHSLLYLDVCFFSFCCVCTKEQTNYFQYCCADSGEHIYNALGDDTEDLLCPIQARKVGLLISWAIHHSPKGPGLLGMYLNDSVSLRAVIFWKQ